MRLTERQLPFVAGLVLLLIRGALLWLVVPVAVVAWIVGWPFFRYRKVRCAQLLGWADLNLIAAIEHTLLRPLIRSRLPWIPPSAMSTVSHRIGLADPA